MARTRHMHQRMGQRGITSRLVDLTSQYGIDNGDHIVLDRKNIDELLAGLDVFRKDLLKAHEKGGFVVVESGDTQITAYRINSYNRKRQASNVKH
ncbi:hypothetical protein [Vreelandella titanicae]|uniref:hypothetical protein n=1 Tax=Vreelandella titanicae TaxID=664683 RepID=UPI0039BFD769